MRTSQNGVPAVLVAEDALFVAQELVRMLDGLGCQVIGPFATLEETAIAAQGEPLHAALLDVSLRDDTVFPAAEILLARQVPLAFLTGYAAGLLPPEYHGLPCLEKPFSLPELVRLLALLGLTPDAW